MRSAEPLAAGRRLIAPLILALMLIGVLWVLVRRLEPDSPAPQPEARPAMPEIAPVRLMPLTPERAREINAAVPYVKAGLVPAPAFRGQNGGADFDRARDCLAAAAWYEAGDDAAGERSVIQVVLNRLMHPAFPKTVCGVVFQGAERATGCQFTFSCDGALDRRRPSTPAWGRAQELAGRALQGFTDPAVGLATHYHTDWVVPYWSASLEKIARVGTHLFFRFRGYWGTKPALRRPSAAPEPVIGKLARLSAAHQNGADEPFTMPKPTDEDILALVDQLQRRAATGQLAVPRPQQMAGSTTALKGNTLSVSDPASGQFGLTLDLNRSPASYALVARSLCAERSPCSVLGWKRGMTPATISGLRTERKTAIFTFRRSRAGETALWDCREFDRTRDQCLPGTAPADPASSPDQE